MSDQATAPSPTPPTTTPTPEAVDPNAVLAAKLYPQPVPENPPVTDPAKPEGEKPAPAPETPAAIALKDITLPEGVALDEKASGEFLTLINDPALSKKDLAQKLIDMQLGREKAASEKGVQAWNDLQTQWQETIKADPEIGLGRFDATVASIGRLMDKYGNEETRLAFETTGAGNNPLIVKMFAKMARDLTEPGPVIGSAGSAQESLAAKLYSKIGSV